MVPLRVSAPLVLIVVSAVKLMLPLAVAAVLLLNKAPLELTPVPASDSSFDKVVPLRSNAPPLVTVIVPVPKGPDVGGLAILPVPDFSVPEPTCVPPVYVLALVSNKVLVDTVSLISCPVPDICPDKVWLLVDEYLSIPILIMLPA